MSITTPFDPANFFAAVYVLNMANRPKKLAAFQAETARVKWPFKTPQVFAATDGKATDKKSGVWGCLLSHQAVLQKAITDGSANVLVLEDDAIFKDDFAVKVAAFLPAVPTDWDIIMLGGQNTKRRYIVNPLVCRCSYCMRTHCYAVNGKFMGTLNAAWQASIASGVVKSCSETMAELMAAAKVYSPWSFLAGQRGGHSDVSGGIDPLKHFWG